jgi:predicted Zn-dependent peptidase
MIPAVLMVVLLLWPRAAEPAEPVHRTELPNGVRVIVRENPTAPVVALSLLVDAGTRVERAETAGIGNFLHAVMVKGTRRRTGAELAERIAALGGKLSAAGEVDYAEIRGTALARFWRELLALTTELALEPKLAPDDVVAERAELLARVQRRRDNAASRAFDEFYAALYASHPYALPTIGTPESLRRIDHAAIVEHYRASYRPDRLVIAISGDVPAADVVEEVRRLFGSLAPTSRPEPLPPIPAPVSSPGRRVIEQPAQQTQILTGALGPSLHDADHGAVKVLGAVLGGGMAGRLFAELRDRRGLAYTATAYYDSTREPGALILYLGTAPENATRAEEALAAEVERITREPVSADELERAKGYLLGRYVMDRRTNERRAWSLAFYALAGAGDDFPDRYRRAVQAVSVSDVQRVARRYLATPTTVVLRPAP